MVFKNNIVAVKFENRKEGGYSERAYSYYCDIPDIKPGDIVKVPTRYGESKAIVHEVGISESTLPGVLRQHLKTITADCLIVDDSGQQQEMDLRNPVEDFFKK